MNLKTVNSVSGGKTSAYMSNFYPAEFNIFALVRIEAAYCMPQDKSIVKYVSDKISEDFIATAESDLTLYAVRDLEQKIGKEIKWVTGKTFEQVIFEKKALPNLMMRFCTTKLKMEPIFNYCHFSIDKIVDMRIGFRYDEKERAERNRLNNTIKSIVGKKNNGKNKWEQIEWRKMSFPLVDDKINHYDVTKWANESQITFPKDSNCVGCFWKPFQQLRQNWIDEPQKMRWFAEMEEKMNRTFKQGMSYFQVKEIGLQQDFFFGVGAGCNAGFCTD